MQVGSRGLNVLAPPLWAKDFGGREHILPLPGRLSPGEFPDAAALIVKVNAAGGVQGGLDEIQTITTDSSGGTWKATFGGQQTGALAFDITAANLQTALRALSSIGANNVNVYGAPGAWSVQFVNALGRQNVAQITTDSTLLTGNAHTAVVATVQGGVAGAVAIPVDAVSQVGAVASPVTPLGPVIPTGTILQFSGGGFAVVGAPVSLGDTSIAVSALTGSIADHATARYSAFGRKYVPSGSVVGRTLAEATANTDWGRAVGSDDLVYLIMFDVVDANRNPDCEFYRHGGMVAENYLPQDTKDAIAADATLEAKLRAAYVFIIATD